jgi:hypothetical protein
LVYLYFTKSLFMKHFIPALLLMCFCATQTFGQTTSDHDIVYVHDGKLSEWNLSKLATDTDNKISYAIDNDGEYLYIGLQIPDIATQMKMMRTGMSVYIDLKGKKKTNRSIEFPIVQEQSQAGFGPPGGEQSPARSRGRGEAPDPATIKMNQIFMRNGMVLTRFKAIKLSGFGNNGIQDLNVPGSVQVAYKCDTTEVVEFEYKIPLSMLGEITSLTNKQISLGFKIHGIAMPSDAPMSPGGVGGGGMGGGAPRGGGRAPGGMGGGPGSGGMNRDAMMKEQSFWTTYTFTQISVQAGSENATPR